MINVVLTFILTLLAVISDRLPYYFVIRKWASFFDLQLTFTSRYTDCFECDLDDKILYISRYNKSVHNRDEYIASIAHEVGHLIGAAIDEKYPEKYQLSRRSSKKSIYLDEARAWKIAEILLQDAELYNPDRFISLRDRCLLEYRKALYGKKKYNRT